MFFCGRCGTSNDEKLPTCLGCGRVNPLYITKIKNITYEVKKMIVEDESKEKIEKKLNKLDELIATCLGG